MNVCAYGNRYRASERQVPSEQRQSETQHLRLLCMRLKSELETWYTHQPKTTLRMPFRTKQLKLVEANGRAC